jgi:hypothetical protein
MPGSASAFPKLCSPCYVNLRPQAAGSERSYLVLGLNIPPGHPGKPTDHAECPVLFVQGPGGALDQCDECCLSGGSALGLMESGV